MSALTVGVVLLIARSCGAQRGAATIAALGFATTASFWLNAGFAKHYPFTTLTIALPILFVFVWQQQGGVAWLVATGTLFGLALGSGWELAAIAAVALAFASRFARGSPRDGHPRRGLRGGDRRRLRVGIRARARRPASDDQLGEASNPGRLVRLVAGRDFQGVNGPSGGTPTNFFGRLVSLSAGLERDFGAAVVLLAFAGAFAWRHMRRKVRAFLLAAGLLNLLAVAIDSGLGQINGFLSVISGGGTCCCS